MPTPRANSPTATSPPTPAGSARPEPTIALMPFQEQILAASRDAPILALPAARLGRSTLWGPSVLARSFRTLWQMQRLRRVAEEPLPTYREDDAPSPANP